MSCADKPDLLLIDPVLSGPEGLVGVGGELSVANLFYAYSRGVFPWPIEGQPMLWFCPPQRGVLDFKDFHIPRSVQRLLRKAENQGITYTLNKCFPEVMRFCREQRRKGQNGTWITREMLEAYVRFHKAGYAQSVEVWRGELLIGGLYGVYVNGVFSGESMFHREPGASKLALIKTVSILRQAGLEWMDIQMVTPLLAQFGGRLIPREQFLKRVLAHLRRSNFKNLKI